MRLAFTNWTFTYIRTFSFIFFCSGFGFFNFGFSTFFFTLPEDLKTDTSVIAVDEMKQSSAPVAFAAILEKPKRSSLLITPQTALGLLKGNHQEMSSEGVGDNDHNTADGFLTCAFGASGNEEIAPSETRPTEDIADVETAWTKFSSAAREKRRKFGTMAAPRIEAIVQGGGASWAKARKHIKRLRKKDVVPGDSELLIPAGVSFGKSESNDSVRLSSTNIEPETVASASLSQTEGEQVVEYVSSPVPESAVQQETQTESPLFPNVEESFGMLPNIRVWSIFACICFFLALLFIWSKISGMFTVPRVCIVASVGMTLAVIYAFSKY